MGTATLQTSRGARERLDEAMVERGLADSRSRAKALILARDVTVNGVVVVRAGSTVQPSDRLDLVERPRFASRGGEKLARALRLFGIDVSGWVAADFGASTGGFTDCLLQAGAERVYAVDVGYGQLAERLRRDERVIVSDRTNARFLERLPEPVGIVTIDVSFIPLNLVLPAAARVLSDAGTCVPLIKPQFEAGRRDVGRGGVVRDENVHRRVLHEVIGCAEDAGFGVRDVTRSPLRGPAGNVEFLAHLVRGEGSTGAEDVVEQALAADEAGRGE